MSCKQRKYFTAKSMTIEKDKFYRQPKSVKILKQKFEPYSYDFYRYLIQFDQK